MVTCMHVYTCHIYMDGYTETLCLDTYRHTQRVTGQWYYINRFGTQFSSTQSPEDNCSMATVFVYSINLIAA